jgi:hypothetical protein
MPCFGRIKGGAGTATFESLAIGGSRLDDCRQTAMPGIARRKLTRVTNGLMGGAICTGGHHHTNFRWASSSVGNADEQTGQHTLSPASCETKRDRGTTFCPASRTRRLQIRSTPQVNRRLGQTSTRNAIPLKTGYPPSEPVTSCTLQVPIPQLVITPCHNTSTFTDA